jgi:hypothetical protein
MFQSPMKSHVLTTGGVAIITLLIIFTAPGIPPGNENRSSVVVAVQLVQQVQSDFIPSYTDYSEGPPG